MAYRWPTEIYLAVRSDGIRKIGCSRNSDKRIKEISRSYGSLYVIEQVWQRPNGDALPIEQIVHTRILKDQAIPDDLSSREHYQMSRDEAVAAIEKAIERYRPQSMPCMPPAYTPPVFYSWPRPLEPDDGLSLKERSFQRRLADYRAAHPEVVVPEFKKRNAK